MKEHSGRSRRKRQKSTPVRKGAVSVNEYSLGWLKKGFDWVYSKEIQSRDPLLKSGDTVSILSPDGRLHGRGIYSLGEVAVRRFRADDGPIDRPLLKTKILAAAAARFLPEGTDVYRLIHGENDDLPGIRVDVWGRELSLVLACRSLQPLVDDILPVLIELFPSAAVWGHIRDGDTVSPLGLLHGDADAEGCWAQELSLSYWVVPSRSPDAGLFCDMRSLRDWMQPHWVGKRVLNSFCFTGAFSVSAAANGAEEVVSVDLSGTYLDWLKKNLVQNGIDPGSHPCVEADGFQALDRFRRKGESFDVVLLDPPSFSHGPAGVWSVQRDLGRLVGSALRVLRPGGWLIVATNHGKMSPKEFAKAVLDGSRRTNRRLRIIHQHCPPMDIPAALHFPESRYLKCWVLQG
jgi:23S rRNA (cytosine1962-C5)-methyltransferase